MVGKDYVVKLKWQPGHHFNVTIYVGVDKDHFIHTGHCCFAPEEAVAFRQTVKMGIQKGGFVGFFEEDWKEPWKIRSNDCET